MKKKARFQELSDIEAKYNVMKERESLDLRRRQHLIEFIENAASAAVETKKCFHSSKLVKLASQILLKPEFCNVLIYATFGEDLLQSSINVSITSRGVPRKLGG